MLSAPRPGSVAVIGTGLIGTSIALALRKHGVEVWLSDRDPAAAAMAAELGAGRLLTSGALAGQPADIAVLAVPPGAVAGALAKAQRSGLARCYTDAASVKQLPLEQARRAGCDLASFVPSHPMSGRERSGPSAAQADLFAGRSWVICPAPETAPECVDAVTGLALACDAQPVTMPAREHDQVVALISHAPHLVAAAMAAQCGLAPAAALALAGPGLRDVTRIAAGDPDLWAEILTANASAVSQVLVAVADRLATAAGDLAAVAAGEQDAAKGLAAVLTAGQAGAEAIPGKRGGPAPHYAVVQVVIGDRPGELAGIFAAAGAAGINVEDIRIEHTPGLEVGIAELSVRPERARELSAALSAAGWPVASPS